MYTSTTQPSWNDNSTTLLRKIAQSLYQASGGIPTVADANARLSLTGISPGYQVRQLDNNTVYQLVAPSTAQGGVFVAGGTQDGIYETGSNNGGFYDGKLYFEFLGNQDATITWDDGELRLYLDNAEGDHLYYSLSDVATPDLATNWKNASDDSPASITVTSVTQGELDAGVTVAGAGTSSVNGIYPANGSEGTRVRYEDVNENYVQYDNDGSFKWVVSDGVSYYFQDNDTIDAFPWQTPFIDWDGFVAPVPTVTRNDIAAEANWDVVGP